MTADQSVGFIGLGQMGQPMVASLAKHGADLTVFDVQAEVATTVARKINARLATSISDIGKHASVVVLSLPNSQIVRDVVLGDSATAGLVESLKPGAIIIDMSSSEPSDTRSLGEHLGESDIHLVDAPVSGGVKKAITGTLTIMIGGEPSVIDSIDWLFYAMGERQFRTGVLGSGHAMKALNNYVSAAGLAAASEAVLVGGKFGLEPALIIDILNVSTGRNNSTENKFHQLILSEKYNSGFSMALMAKDVGIAAALAQQANVEAPLLGECSNAWKRASSSLGPTADHTEFPRFLRGN